MLKKTILIALLFFSLFKLIAQDNSKPEQVIRGKVVDKQSQTPLPGANIILLESDPPLGTSTNSAGDFRL